MEDYLKQYCANTSLELVYTNNKFTLLSCSSENNLPTVRVHKVFKNCSKEVANAIVKYYTDFKNKNSYLKIIEAYLEKHYPSDQYKIKDPTEAFNLLLANRLKTSKQKISDQKTKKEESMVEVGVLSIKQKRFSGVTTNISPDDSLKGLSDDPLELEIIVTPFNT